MTVQELQKSFQMRVGSFVQPPPPPGKDPVRVMRWLQGLYYGSWGCQNTGMLLAKKSETASCQSAPLGVLNDDKGWVRALDRWDA